MAGKGSGIVVVEVKPEPRSSIYDATKTLYFECNKTLITTKTFDGIRLQNFTAKMKDKKLPYPNQKHVARTHQHTDVHDFRLSCLFDRNLHTRFWTHLHRSPVEKTMNFNSAVISINDPEFHNRAILHTCVLLPYMRNIT